MVDGASRRYMIQENMNRHQFQLERMVMKEDWDGLIYLLNTAGKSRTNNLIEEELMKNDLILELLEDEKDNKKAQELLLILIALGGRDLVMRCYDFICYGEEDSCGEECSGTLLHAALGFNACTKIVSRLLQVGGRELVRTKDKDNRNSLHFACTFNASAEVVSQLLEVGGLDLLLEKYRGRTPLHLACRCRYKSSFEMVSKLIELGGWNLLLEKNKYGSNALHDACGNSAPLEVVSKLLEVGERDLLERNNSGRNPLHYACWSNASVEVVSKLIEFGGRRLVLEKDKQGYNSLHCVFISENLRAEVILKLLEAGGSDLVREKDVCGKSAFHLSFENDEVSVELLLKLIDVGGRELALDKDKNGRNTFSMLLEVGVSDLSRKKDKFEEDSFDSSFEGDGAFTAILLKLIEVGGGKLVLNKDVNGHNTLVHAFQHNAPTKVITKILEIGGKDMILERDTGGWSPFVHFLEKATFDQNIFDLLVCHGGEEILLQKDFKEKTPLQYLITQDTASIRQKEKRVIVEKISVLMNKGIQFNIGSEFGIGGLFNSSTNQEVQDKIFDVWDELVLPALEEVMALPHNYYQPVLQATIINRAPKRVILSTMIYLSHYINIRDSFGRYPIDVAVQYGLSWDDGMKEIFEAFVFQWYRGR